MWENRPFRQSQRKSNTSLYIAYSNGVSINTAWYHCIELIHVVVMLALAQLRPSHAYLRSEVILADLNQESMQE